MTDDADAVMSGMEGHVRDKKYLPVLMPKMTGSGLRVSARGKWTEC